MMEMKQKITYFNEKTGEITEGARELELIREDSLDKQVESNVVGLYPDYLFQKIDGFGCAMTERKRFRL